MFFFNNHATPAIVFIILVNVIGYPFDQISLVTIELLDAEKQQVVLNVAWLASIQSCLILTFLFNPFASERVVYKYKLCR